MIFEKISEILAEQFGLDVESITMDSTFEGDLDADSVDIVEVSMALEDEFGIGEMSEEDLAKILTVGDLVRYVQNKVD